jgi:hypothetical protein
VKREDRVYPYRGYGGSRANCHLRMYEMADYTVIIATELPDNPGTSVTNFAEYGL